MDMVAKNFENFGIRLAEAKMVTMTWNMPMETMTKKLRLTRPGTRQPWRTKKTPQFLTYQVGSAYRAGKRMKMVLTDFRITLKNRVIIRQSMVRSRLTYASGPGECGWKKKNLDSVWWRMCRKLVWGGFRRNGREGEKEKIQIKYSNNDIVKIYKTQPASAFCEAQHLKCIGRVLGCKTTPH